MGYRFACGYKIYTFQLKVTGQMKIMSVVYWICIYKGVSNYEIKKKIISNYIGDCNMYE